MVYLYILRSLKYHKTYVGISDNIQRRIQEHNNGKSKFTSRYKPWELMYKEECLTRADAFKKERYFKSSAGRKKIKNNIFRGSSMVERLPVK